MSSTHNYNTRASAKRKRLGNQEDEAPAPKARKMVTKPRYKLSEAAERGQRTERKRLAKVMKTRGPEDEIDGAEFASSGTQPELRYYGWPFNYDHMVAYAQRHHLRFPLPKRSQKFFGGREEVDFAELTEEHLRNPVSRIAIRHAAVFMAVEKLEEATGMQLFVDRPFSLDWDGIVYIWSNYDAEERWEVAEGLNLYDNAVEVMNEAMNEELKGEPSRLQWWYTWNNDVSRYSYERS